MSNVVEKTESHAYKCGACPYLFHCTDPEECVVVKIEAMHSESDGVVFVNNGGLIKEHA